MSALGTKRTRQTGYTPSSEGTSEIYGDLLRLVKTNLPPGPDDEVEEITDRVIALLRSGSRSQAEKLKELATVLGFGIGHLIPQTTFTDMLVRSKQLTDFIDEDGTHEDDDGGMGGANGPSAPATRGDGENAMDFVRVDGEDDLEDEEDSENDDDEAADQDGVDGAWAAEDDDEDDDSDDEVRFIDIHAVKNSAKYLEEEIKRQLPTTAPHEWAQLATKIFDYISNEKESNVMVEAQLASILLSRGGDESWIESVVKYRWTVSYGIQLALCGGDRDAENKVMHKMRVHGRSGNKAVAVLLQQLTGEDVTAKGASGATGGDENDDDAVEKPLQIVDIEGMRFESEASVLRSAKVTVPKGSKRVTAATHSEIIIPAAPKNAEHKRRVPIESFPAWAQEAFPQGVTSLNPMQSIVMESAFQSDENMLVCAPTGAGKTNVAMMTILRVLHNYRDEAAANGLGFDLESFKMVYVAPMKALVQEVVRTFGDRLAPLGINVAELSGDSSLSKEQLLDTQLIVTTPEKWDIVTRKSIELGVASFLKLIIIDEVHLLHNERGPVLEAIVARTNLQIERTGEPVRLVGLSATLPNYKDVAAFLKVNEDRGLFFFDKSFRPVPLQQTFCAYNKAATKTAALNAVCYQKVMEQATRGASTLVFVHSRKDTEATADYLMKEATRENKLHDIVRPGTDTKTALEDAAADMNLRESLRNLLPNGFAIHHAGMSKHERNTVEQLFLEKKTQVLVCTSTLAWGVNLPAHAVVIKGTQVFAPKKGGWTSLSSLDVFQMFGRAGRPGYDDSGEAVIITSQDELPFYLKMLNNQMNIESQLMSRVVDMLNAEVQLGTVGSISEAAKWLGHTYLYVRMRRDAQLYGAKKNSNDPLMKRHRENIAHTASLKLADERMITYDESLRQLGGTLLGRIASHFYLTHRSVATYSRGLHDSMTDVEMTRLFAKSDEFSQIPVRHSESFDLKSLKDTCPIAIDEPHNTALCKVNVLLQSFISRKSLTGTSLNSEMVYIRDSAERIWRAMHEIALAKQMGSTARKALEFYMMIQRRQWANVETPLRQFEALEPNAQLIPKLIKDVEAQRIPWQQYVFYTVEDCIGLLNGNEDAASALERLIHCVPRVEVTANCKPMMRSAFMFDVSISPRFDYVKEYHGAGQSFVLTIETLEGHVLVQEDITLRASQLQGPDADTPPDDVDFTFIVKAADPLPPHYFVRVMSTSWLGCYTEVPVRLWQMQLPEKEPQPTERKHEDGEVPVAALGELFPHLPDTIGAMAEKLFPFKHFLGMQAQTLQGLLDSEENAFVAMPPGCGKTVCAELFALSSTIASTDGKLVCVLPTQAQAQRRCSEWVPKFQDGLGVSVALLDGNSHSDIVAFSTSRIIVTTPTHLNAILRRPKLKALQFVTHVVLDHLHRLRSGDGLQYELCVARIRQVMSNPALRLLGLSYSTTCASDLGKWLGVDPQDDQHFFNFSLAANRRLSAIIRECDVPGYRSRYQQVVKDTLHLLNNDKYRRARTVVFVPTTLEALDIATECYQVHRLPQLEDELELNPNAKKPEDLSGIFEDEELATWAAVGVGCLHNGVSQADINTQLDIVETAAMPFVLFAAFDQSTQLPAASFDYSVVCMAEKPSVQSIQGYVDCAVAEVLHMASRANYEALVFCRSTKRFLWDKFLNGSLPVESQVLDHLDLLDAVNAQIAEGRVTDMISLMKWLSKLFYYRRIQSNPVYYALASNKKADIRDRISELTEDLIQELSGKGYVAYNAAEGHVGAQTMGVAAAHHAVSSDAVEPLVGCIDTEQETSVETILQGLAQVGELHSLFDIRHGESAILGRAVFQEVLPEASRPEQGTLSFQDPDSKTYALLLSHCTAVNWYNIGDSRVFDLLKDVRSILTPAATILVAAVDFLSASLSWDAIRTMMTVVPMLLHGAHPEHSLGQCSPVVTPALDLLLKKALPNVSNEELLEQLAKRNATSVEALRAAVIADIRISEGLTEEDGEVSTLDEEQVGGALESILSGAAALPHIKAVSSKGQVFVNAETNSVEFAVEVKIQASKLGVEEAPDAEATFAKYPTLRPRPVGWWVVCYNGHDDVPVTEQTVYSVRRLVAPAGGDWETSLRFELDAAAAVEQEPKVAVYCDSFFVKKTNCAIEIVEDEEQ